MVSLLVDWALSHIIRNEQHYAPCAPWQFIFLGFIRCWWIFLSKKTINRFYGVAPFRARSIVTNKYCVLRFLSVCNRKHPPRSIFIRRTPTLTHAQNAHAFLFPPLVFGNLSFFEKRLCDCPSALQKQQGRDQFPFPWRGRILIFKTSQCISINLCASMN